MIKNITLGQYFPGDSVMHRMDPRMKFLLTLALIVLIFCVQTVYGYAATGAELEEDIAIQETIPLTPGEWDLEISFVFRSAGGDSPAALHISAQCQSLTQEDLTYLKELRPR